MGGPADSLDIGQFCDTLSKISRKCALSSEFSRTILRTLHCPPLAAGSPLSQLAPAQDSKWLFLRDLDPLRWAAAVRTPRVPNPKLPWQ